MARGKRSPEELLAVGAKPTIEELFRAIHEVNPTGRALSPGETARRYTTKARLQSALLRRFPELVAVEDEDDGRVVLRHRRAEVDFVLCR